MSSPEEPSRPVPPKPGHEPAAGQPEVGEPSPGQAAAGQPLPGEPPIPYYAAPSAPPSYGAPLAGIQPYAPPANGAPPYGPPASGAPPYGPPANNAPPYGPPYYGGPTQPPPKKSRKALWIVLAIVGAVLLLVAAGVVILLNVVGGATNQARGLSDEFTKLIIAGDVNNAYEKYLDPALMQKLSREEFAVGVQSLGLDGSCKPTYSSVKVSSSNGANAADVVGLIECDTKRVELVYRFEGRDELKMVNIRLRPQR